MLRIISHTIYESEFEELEAEVRLMYKKKYRKKFESIKTFINRSDEVLVKLWRTLTTITPEHLTDKEIFPYIFEYPTLVRYARALYRNELVEI